MKQNAEILDLHAGFPSSHLIRRILCVVNEGGQKDLVRTYLHVMHPVRVFGFPILPLLGRDATSPGAVDSTFDFVGCSEPSVPRIGSGTGRSSWRDWGRLF